MTNKPHIKVKRAYEASATSDGCRVLVDRVWPRGVSKDELRLDDWIKEVAPSARLRRWFNHDRAKWDAFQARYAGELDGHAEAVHSLLDRAGAETLTLVFGAKDTECNNATALRAYLERKAAKEAEVG